LLLPVGALPHTPKRAQLRVRGTGLFFRRSEL
jgi:hypothetical protein